ncbi:DUF1254 domain-containing protein [Nocardia sp. NPDC127579]|uniref:DUF1254 domain-containing protein n=1 Tax=Nocardia sp. NPDC127579 TaxID=3345402 RepID=UPI0036371272
MRENVSGVGRRAMLGMLGLAMASGTALAACGSDDSSSSSGTSTSGSDPTGVATDAYVFGYPLVLVDATRGTAPVNQFMHADSLPTAADRVVVRMNLDTLYSQAWLDLSAEPLVMQIPDMGPDRYWLMQMLDAWSNTAHNPSSVRPQTTPGQTTPPFTYLATGPGWNGTVPDGMTRLEFPTNTVWVIGRVQVDGESDIAAVRAIQEKMKLAPLSAWQADPNLTTPGMTIPDAQKATSPAAAVAAMDGTAFFTKLCQLMSDNPPAPDDHEAMTRFAPLGITPGGTPTADPAVLNAAVTKAKQQIADFKDPEAQNDNGWLFSTDVGAYGTDYPLRAHTAYFGLGANLAEDALYPSLNGVADADGRPRRFRLHFPAGQLPPVDAFWSLTAYDGDSYLIDNPAGIYAVGHQIPVTANPDGSVDIAVQNADPGAAVPRGNWLPIPVAGKFSLTLRLYAPKSEAAEGKWQPPALEAVS